MRGPPGSGKTLMAKALAGEAKVDFSMLQVLKLTVNGLEKVPGPFKSCFAKPEKVLKV